MTRNENRIQKVYAVIAVLCCLIGLYCNFHSLDAACDANGSPSHFQPDYYLFVLFGSVQFIFLCLAWKLERSFALSSYLTEGRIIVRNLNWFLAVGCYAFFPLLLILNVPLNTQESMGKFYLLFPIILALPLAIGVVTLFFDRTAWHVRLLPLIFSSLGSVAVLQFLGQYIGDTFYIDENGKSRAICTYTSQYPH